MELRRKPLRGWKAIGVILAIVAAVFLSTFIANLLALWVRQLAYLSYAAVFLLAIYVYKRFIVEYRYSLTEGGTFLVERLAGTRARELFKGKLSGAEFYGAPNDAPPTQRSHRFLLFSDAENARALILPEKGSQVTLFLQPDERMDELIALRIRGGEQDEEENPDDPDEKKEQA